MVFQGYRRTPFDFKQHKELASVPTAEREKLSVPKGIGEEVKIGAHLCHRVLHDLFILHITLVTHKQLVDTLGGIAIDLLEPLLHIVEGIHVSNIIHDADTMSTSIVRRSNGAEPLLARSVPLKILLAT